MRVYVPQDETSEIDVDLTDIHLKVDCSLEGEQEEEDEEAGALGERGGGEGAGSERRAGRRADEGRGGVTGGEGEEAGGREGRLRERGERGSEWRMERKKRR